MSFLLIIISTLVLPLIEGHCIYTENYWYNRPLEEWPSGVRNYTLCNQSWYTLFQTTSKNTTLWNNTFRELCVASLNHYEGPEVEEVWKGMEGGCLYEARWKDAWQVVLPRFMSEVEKYNRGTGKHPLCPLTSPSLVESPRSDELQLYVRVLALWCLILTAAVAFLIKRVFGQHRLFNSIN